jgi:hypothetical protein
MERPNSMDFTALSWPITPSNKLTSFEVSQKFKSAHTLQLFFSLSTGTLYFSMLMTANVRPPLFVLRYGMHIIIV